MAFNSQEITVLVTVNPINDAPVAVDDSYSVDENTIDQLSSLVLDDAAGLLQNDTDADLDSLTAELIDPPANGVLVLNEDGSLTYTPAASFSGTDSFTYRASDGVATSDPATVTIQVNDINQAPVSFDDNYVVQADEILAVIEADGALANDTDADGDTLLGFLRTTVRLILEGISNL